MQPLGTMAPDFSLPDVVSGKTVTRDGAKGAGGLLVMFLCVHCPFVKHVEQGIARFAGDYAGQGLGIVGISSNDAVAFPDDAPEGMRAQAKRLGISTTSHNRQHAFMMLRARRTSFSTTATCGWYIADSSMPAARV
jgi:peroxiredoxin